MYPILDVNGFCYTKYFTIAFRYFMSINKRYRWVLLLDVHYLRFRLLLRRDILTSLLSKSIANRRPLHGIVRGHKLVFRLQSLYYFGIKVVPSMVTNHLYKRFSLATVHWLFKSTKVKSAK
jgi:hypothetical protein